MARASMEDIIARVRGMIGDVGESDDVHFSDDEIQAALDRRSRWVVELPLDSFVTRDSNGDEQYVRWIADRAPWESDVALLDEHKVPYAESAIDEADPMNGQWVFESSQDEVFVSGRTFDLYAAAADLLEQWNSTETAVSGSITEWETDGQRVKRSDGGSSVNRASLAAQYRAQQQPVTLAFERNDTVSTWP